MPAITEVKTIKIKTSTCLKRPVYVRWVNTSGGIDYYPFEFRQTYETTVSDMVRVNLYIQRLSLTNGTHFAPVRTKTKKVVVGAENLTETMYNALQSLHTSPMIEMYIGSKWMEVIADDNSSVRDTFNPANSFECVLILPEEFIVKR